MSRITLRSSLFAKTVAIPTQGFSHLQPCHPDRGLQPEWRHLRFEDGELTSEATFSFSFPSYPRINTLAKNPRQIIEPQWVTRT